MAWRGMAWRGRAGQGKAWFYIKKISRWGRARHGAVRQGLVGQGMVLHGVVWPGRARLGLLFKETSKKTNFFWGRNKKMVDETGMVKDNGWQEELKLRAEECYYVCLGMKVYGGSFAKALGQALNLADVNNQGLIRMAWPELWKQYLEMGKLIDEKRKA